MKVFLVIVLLIFGASPLFAQPYIGWVQRFNGSSSGYDIARAIAPDKSGNVYVTGYSYNASTWADFITIKYDSLGNQLWIQRYDGPTSSFDKVSALAIDDSGNVYVTGSSIGTEDGYDFATIKYYPRGDTAWVRRYNGSGSLNDEAVAIAVDAGGNVYVSGSITDTGTPPPAYPDYLTIKYDRNGNQLWVATYDGPLNQQDRVSSMTLDHWGNIYVTGTSFGVGSFTDYATIKYDSLGNQLWAARHNGPGNYVDQAYDLAVDSSGNVIVTGKSAQNSFWVIIYDYSTVKYDANGNILWEARHLGQGDGRDGAGAIALDFSGNIFVTGSNNAMNGTNADYTTIKYYPNGDMAWVQRYSGLGRNDPDQATDIVADSIGNVYVTGYSAGNNFFLSYDFATLKYRSNGDAAWTGRYDGLAKEDDKATAITLDNKGNVYVVGSSEAIPLHFGSPDFVTIKYSTTALLKGDLDRSGMLTLNDVISLLNCVFSGEGECPPAFADVNCDAFLTPTDVVVLLNVFYQLAAPPC